MAPYKCKETLQRHNIDIHGIDYAVHCWGSPDAEAVFLLHGWADTGRSFQFLADELADSYFLIAPDWRGFGDSAWSPQGYWFPDYLADLDAITNHFKPGGNLKIVGHSMGGNIACLYAGARPKQVTDLVSLDVYGLPATDPAMAPDRYAQWMDQLRKDYAFTTYDDLQALTRHIQKLAPGLDTERASLIAESWSRESSNSGEITLKADPAHKRVNPVLYRREEARACWQKIQARSLFIYGGESRMYKSYMEEGYREEFIECIENFEEQVIDGAGHMLHLQQPGELASRLRHFLGDSCT